MVRLGSEVEDDAVGAHAPLLEVVNDDVLLLLSTFLDADGLRAWKCACKRTKALPLEPCWRELCRARWADKPRYALTPEREAFLARASFAMPQSWRARYDFFERDRQRAFLSADELEGLHWHFNFTPAAGGRGRASLQRVQFDGRCLRVPGFPPLPYILEPRAADGSALDADDDEAGEGPAAGTFAMMRDMLAALPELPQQRLLIANFPPHVVSRLDSDWEWLITNDNVTLVSSGTDDVVAYDERSFQTPPAPDHPMPPGINV